MMRSMYQAWQFWFSVLVVAWMFIIHEYNDLVLVRIVAILSVSQVVWCSASLFYVWSFNLVFYRDRESKPLRNVLRKYRRVADTPVRRTTQFIGLVGLFIWVLSIVVDHWWFFVSGPLVLMNISVYARASVPPFALMLATSGDEAYDLAKGIARQIHPFTVTELTDPASIDTGIRNRIDHRHRDDAWLDSSDYFFSRYFISSRIEGEMVPWKWAVEIYCLIARVIVINLGTISSFTIEEMDIIDKNDLWYKVIILNDGIHWRELKKRKNALEDAMLFPRDARLTAMYIAQLAGKNISPTKAMPISGIPLD